MGVLESVKERVEKVTGWKRPSRDHLRRVVRSRKPNSFCFKDDGIVPNNPTLHLSFTAARSASRTILIRRRYLKSCLHATAGAIPGATAFTITRTITRGLTKCSVLRAAMPGFALAANAEGNFTSRPAM